MDTEKLTVLRWNAKVPLIDVSAVEHILGSLAEMEVTLDSDPLSLGPTRLQKKIAKARNLLTRVEKWFHLVHRADHDVKRALLMSKSLFSLKEKDLLANDPEVKRASAQKSREAIAHYKLREDLEECFSLEQAVSDTEAVLLALSTKRTDLKDLVSRLRDQIQLCTAEIGLNKKWGADPEETLSTKVDNLRLEAHPELTKILEVEHDVILDDILGDDSDCNVPSRRSLETRALRMNKEDPVTGETRPSEKVNPSCIVGIIDSPIADTSSSLPAVTEALPVETLTPSVVYDDLVGMMLSQQSQVVELEGASEFKGAETFEDVSMDELQGLLNETRGQVEEVKTRGVSLDGLPEDFWG